MLMRRAVLLGIMLLGISGTSSAQVVGGTPQGTPPFGAISAGPADSIDLANLNVHIVIPVLHRAGRGIPFSYDVTYDTSVWAPYGSVWITSGPPNSSFGWFFPQQGGVQNSAIGATYCGSPYPTGAVVTYGVIYYDPLGTRHPLQGILTESSGSCGSGYSFSGGGPATDGSGYVLSADSSGNIKVTAKSGQVVYWSNSNNNYVQPVATDHNGNQVTFATSNSVFTDTLGVTALTLGGTGTPSSPKTFTYTAPSGGNAAYTLKYTAYTVKTNFGCSGISDYGPTTQNLPSELDLPDGTKYTFTYEATPGYSGDVTGRLASVTFPTGGTINYAYTGGNNGIECKDGSTAGLTRQTPDGTWTYSRTLGTGAASTTTITAPLYNGQNNQTVMNFQGIYPTETQAYQGSASSGTLLKTTFTCYNNASVPCNSTSITLPITLLTSIVRWPNGLQSQKNTYYDATSYGLVTRTDEYDYGSNNTTGALLRTTLISYASLTNGIVNKPFQVSVYDGSNNLKAQTTYTYDQGSVTPTSSTPQHVSISGSRGNPTTISSLVSGSSTLSKTFTYYDTGNVNAATDINGAQTTYTYGTCGNSFPTLVSGPLNLSKSMAWSCTGSVTTSQTDANNATASTGFTDSYFWRANSMTDPMSNVTALAYASETSVETSLSITGNSTADVLSTLDTLGRAHVAQRKQSPSATTYDSSETDYDALGRPSKTTLPYAGSAGQLCSGSCPAKTTTYDALSRPLQVTDGGGGYTSYSYVGNDVYVTAGPAPSGENTKRRQLEYDGLGRLTSVCEITNATGSGTCGQTSTATGYWTKYTYDTNNNLTGVTQNAQSGQTQTRSYAYDDLSRMTSETNPESGTKTYFYDTTPSGCWDAGASYPGDLVATKDAVGTFVCIDYDALHRIGDIWNSAYSTANPCKRFRYDNTQGVTGSRPSGVTVNNPYGRLVEIETDACPNWPPTPITDEWFSYTARGETSDVWQSTPHSGGYYHISQSYWANGAPDVLGNNIVSLPAITYALDGEGRITSASVSAGQNPLSSTTYNTASLPTQVNLGSGDSDSYAYDPNTNRMTQYSFKVNGQSLTGTLTWNPLGTLGSLAISDPFNSADTQICSYGHDDLVRIASANCGSAASQTFSYDAFGNINKSGSPYSFSPSYSSATNRMTQIGSSSPTYDADGNVTNDFLHTYAWDAYGRPITIDGVGVTYDALGRMVEQNSSGTYMQIVWSPTGWKLAYMNGQTLVQGNFSLPAGAVVAYNSSGLLVYHHADWLGSYRLASTPNRTVYWDGAYAPFGEPYAQSGSQVDLSFTGMNQDTVHNLYDFPDREYGIQGRWPSPDPAGISSAHLKDPQSWNRYVYVRNSPLRLIDALGLDYGCNDVWDNPCAGFGGGAYWNLNEEWAVETSGSTAPSGDAQCPADGCGTPIGKSAQPTGTSQNLYSAAQSSSQTATQNSDSGAGDRCTYVLQNPCGAAESMPTSISVTGQTYLPQPGQVSIGALFDYQVLDQNGQPFTGGDGWSATEYITGTGLVNGQLVTIPPADFNPGTAVMNSSGTLTDRVFMNYTGSISGPASQGRDQTIFFTPSGWPLTGPPLPYSVTVGWFLQATGPNQGVILGSNGASFSH